MTRLQPHRNGTDLERGRGEAADAETSAVLPLGMVVCYVLCIPITLPFILCCTVFIGPCASCFIGNIWPAWLRRELCCVWLALLILGLVTALYSETALESGQISVVIGCLAGFFAALLLYATTPLFIGKQQVPFGLLHPFVRFTGANCVAATALVVSSVQMMAFPATRAFSHLEQITSSNSTFTGSPSVNAALQTAELVAQAISTFLYEILTYSTLFYISLGIIGFYLFVSMLAHSTRNPRANVVTSSGRPCLSCGPDVKWLVYFGDTLFQLFYISLIGIFIRSFNCSYTCTTNNLNTVCTATFVADPSLECWVAEQMVFAAVSVIFLIIMVNLTVFHTFFKPISKNLDIQFSRQFFGLSRMLSVAVIGFYIFFDENANLAWLPFLVQVFANVFLLAVIENTSPCTRGIALALSVGYQITILVNVVAFLLTQAYFPLSQPNVFLVVVVGGGLAGFVLLVGLARYSYLRFMVRPGVVAPLLRQTLAYWPLNEHSESEINPIFVRPLRFGQATDALNKISVANSVCEAVTINARILPGLLQPDGIAIASVALAKLYFNGCGIAFPQDFQLAAKYSELAIASFKRKIGKLTKNEKVLKRTAKSIYSLSILSFAGTTAKNVVWLDHDKIKLRQKRSQNEIVDGFSWYLLGVFLLREAGAMQNLAPNGVIAIDSGVAQMHQTLRQYGDSGMTEAIACIAQASAFGDQCVAAISLSDMYRVGSGVSIDAARAAAYAELARQSLTCPESIELCQYAAGLAGKNLSKNFKALMMISDRLTVLESPQSIRIDVLQRMLTVGEARYGPKAQQLLYALMRLADAIGDDGDQFSKRIALERALSILEYKGLAQSLHTSCCGEHENVATHQT